ncbi:MAG: glycosyltransferase family 39 protein [Bacteroidota bacterium]
MIKTWLPSSKTLLYCVLTISISLRIILALANKGYANDDHVTVSRLIVETGKIPEPQDCWQCYQSKLYHFTVAKLWLLFDLKSDQARFKLAQLLSAFAGILTILICWLAIKKQSFNDAVKLICFSLVALNPKLISINAQTANDSFVILFGTVVIYSLYQLMAKPTVKYFFILILFSVLAAITKTNGLVIIIAVILVLIIKILYTKNYKFPLRKGYLGGLLFFLFATTFCVGYFGEYYGKYKKYGKPVVFNTATGELPHLFEKTNFRNPGVQSVIGGYFTFRIIDLVKNPVISNDEHVYPLHRTSLWSQLYGRANFIYFDNWPNGPWQSSDPYMMAFGRVAIILALLPLAFLLCGLLMAFKAWFRLFFKKNNLFNTHDDWIFDIFNLGFAAFIIMFTGFGRDYSFMKVIYIFPGILAILFPLLKGCAHLHQYALKNKLVARLFNVAIITLLLCYLIPVIDLIIKLPDSPGISLY